ncbi:hypothetical protein Tco_0761168 [Tanacetum coccineum]
MLSPSTNNLQLDKGNDDDKISISQSLGDIDTYMDENGKTDHDTYYSPSSTGRMMETNAKVKWDITNIEFENWGDDEEVLTNEKLSDLKEGNLCEGEELDYKWYEALEDIDLKDETLYNKAILEGSMKEDEELSYDSPIDEWEDFEMNNDDTIQDRKELMDNDNDDIGDLDDYLIQKDAPYYANEEEER